MNDHRTQGIVQIGPLTLASGFALPAAQAAWQASAALSSARDRPVVLLLHGYSSSHWFHAPNPPVDLSAGWGNRLAAPGAGIDTRHFLVLSINHLGSCYGSTGPNCTAPDDTRNWGQAFPRITVADQARFAALAVKALGIDRVHAIIGYSYGGYLAFELGMKGMLQCRRIAVLASAPRGRGSTAEIAALTGLARSPNPSALFDHRLAALAAYGLNPTSAPVRVAAKEWSRRHDATSLLRLRQAAGTFDLSAALPELRPALFMLRARDDRLFPAPKDPRNDWNFPKGTRHVILDSGGHMAPVTCAGTYASALAAFLDS
ncbi:MAG: alpha/beta fold hydrolase [Pararhodobacter sp.]|nr:alpha/beta fold hydrolase [Pararhodobacter sp.]